MSIEQSYNYRSITATLTTSGVVSAEQLQQLSAQHYQRVINLLPNDSQYATADEQQLVEQQHIDYVYIPVDFATPRIDDYQRFASAMQQSPSVKTHVHCAANYRVSAFFGIYAYQYLDWSATQVKQHIESLWQPSEHKPWLTLLQQEIEGF